METITIYLDNKQILHKFFDNHTPPENATHKWVVHLAYNDFREAKQPRTTWVCSFWGEGFQLLTEDDYTVEESLALFLSHSNPEEYTRAFVTPYDGEVRLRQRFDKPCQGFGENGFFEALPYSQFDRCGCPTELTCLANYLKTKAPETAIKVGRFLVDFSNGYLRVYAINTRRYIGSCHVRLVSKTLENGVEKLREEYIRMPEFPAPERTLIHQILTKQGYTEAVSLR